MKLKKTLICILGLCVIGLGVLPLYSTSMVKMNVADLINHSDLIVVGRIVSLTDGFDGNNLPYTEITIQISETLKGSIRGTHTFRQFGLLKPRKVGNGRMYVGVSPDGFPKFSSDEEVMLFLYQTTALGFQPIIGLMQGKFDIKDGIVANGINNLGLFDKVTVDESKIQVAVEASILEESGAPLNEAAQQKMMQLKLEEEKHSIKKLLSTKKGAIEKEVFIFFVRNAAKYNWFN